jgi:hypothetical protein
MQPTGQAMTATSVRQVDLHDIGAFKSHGAVYNTPDIEKPPLVFLQQKPIG